MRLGIFARTFARPSFEQVFDAVKSHGFDCVQFNFSCAGLPTVSQEIDSSLITRIRCELEDRSLFMAALSGTCNLIHPDVAERQECVRRLQMMLPICRELRAPVLTLCTGTRDPENMWRAHPANNSRAAWTDLIGSLEKLLPMAEEQGISLGIEPEPSNVINSAESARFLLDEIKSSSLKIVMDGVNLLDANPTLVQSEVLARACDLLGEHIILAHAKDLRRDPRFTDSSQHRLNEAVRGGEGSAAFNFEHYISLLQRVGFDGSLVLHNIVEDDVASAVAFTRKIIK